MEGLRGGVSCLIGFRLMNGFGLIGGKVDVGSGAADGGCT